MSLEPDRRQELRRQFATYAKTREPALRDELVSAHLGLAEYLARRFANRGEPLDDLVQVASLGLLKALDRFDPERGVEFSTYATHTIVGELKRHFRDKGWSIRAPRRMQELYLRLGKVVASMGQELGRSPTIAELAMETKVSEEEVLEALEAGQAYRSASLDVATEEGESWPHAWARKTLPSKTQNGAPHFHLCWPNCPRERLILQLRFFDGLTQSEIANRLQISQMHVSRLLARSLAQLRAAADSTPG